MFCILNTRNRANNTFKQALQKKDPQLYFAWPVTDKIAPGYSQIIKKPMDFSTMKTKIEEGSYNTLPEFIVSATIQRNHLYSIF